MAKGIKVNLRSMTINSLCILFLISFKTNAQDNVIIDYFDYDNVKDTLYYDINPITDSKAIEPTISIKIILNASEKVYQFQTPYISNPIIGNCGVGCISIYNSSKDTEYYDEYHYSNKFDNWILKISKTHELYEDNSTVSNLPKDYFLGLDGTEYRKCLKKKSFDK